MKKSRMKIVGITAAICIASTVFSGCQVLETLGIQPSKESTPGEVVDLEKAASPVISADPSEKAVYGKEETPKEISVEASSTDGGTLSYQWYKNSTDSNGGGTPIDGATESSFTPPTTDLGTTYYYVVIANRTNDKENPGYATSAVKKVVVQELTVEEAKAAKKKEEEEKKAAEKEKKKANKSDNTGEWKQNEVGWWYEYPDGTYVTSDWKKIKGKWYVFDNKGYMITGWHKSGSDWYYMDQSGAMVSSMVVDGEVLGTDGKWIPSGDTTIPNGAEDE